MKPALLHAFTASAFEFTGKVVGVDWAADAKVCGQAACGRHEEEGVRYPNRRHAPPRWLPLLGQVKD